MQKESKINKLFDKMMNLPPIILLPVLIFLVWGGYRLFKGFFAPKEASDFIKIESKKLSFTEVELKFKVKSLLDAMNGSGTDFKGILMVLKSLKTESDLLFVIKEFGQKKYFATGEANNFMSGYLGTDTNLVGWFQKELSIKELAEIKKEFERLNVNML